MMNTLSDEELEDLEGSTPAFPGLQTPSSVIGHSPYKFSPTAKKPRDRRNPRYGEQSIPLAEETGRPVPAAQSPVYTTEKSAAQGHWRRLEQGEKGRGPGGEPQLGRTWVHKNNLSADVIPKPHQIDFEKAIRNMPDTGGIIAAHGTGTGKTLTAVNAFEKLKGEGRAKRALVITPSGLRTNFLEKGVQKFTKSKGVILDRPREVGEGDEYAIVSYDAFRRNPQEFINKVKPDTLIADEVHRAANPESQNYQSLMLARQQVPRFMGLTASVVQNDPREIIPLLKLTTGGKTDVGSEGTFRKMYITKTPSAQRGIFGGKTYEENLVRTAMLRAKVGGTIHYVEDLDASEKPKEVDELVEVPMSPDQVELYRMSMKGIDPVIVNKIEQGLPVDRPKEMKMVFTRLLKARQVSNSLNTVIPGMTPEEAADKTPKIRKVIGDAADHIRRTPDGQVVLYTNFVHGGVDVLEAGLKRSGIPYGVFAGRGVPGVTEEKRQQAVRDYLDGKIKALIITGAGAEGLSLGNTTMVQLVDGHYNPERINQAKARGIRAGGLSHRPPEERKVVVKSYVSTLPRTFWQKITFRPADKGTDEFVYSTAERKARLNRQLRDVLADRAAYEKKRRESTLFRWFGGGP